MDGSIVAAESLSPALQVRGTVTKEGGSASDGYTSSARAAAAAGVPPADELGVVSRASGANPRGATSSGAAHPPDDDQDADADDVEDTEDSGPALNVYEHQPCIEPSPTVVEIVASVLRTVGQRDGDSGKDVLRKLLMDSLLCLVRSEPRLQLAAGEDVIAGGSRKDWLAVGTHTCRWWPMWRAPEILGRMEVPKTNFAGVFHRGRVAKSSRWVLLVSMKGIKKSVESLSVRSSRFFPKMQLPDQEPVLRVYSHKPLRLTLVVASMLLLFTKEDRYPENLARLAADGRSSVIERNTMATAGRHEFFSSSLRASKVAERSSGRPASTTATVLKGLEELGAQHGSRPLDMARRLANMKATLAAEGVKESAINRSTRIAILRARAAARATPAARLPPRPAGQRSFPASTAALVLGSAGTRAGRGANVPLGTASAGDGAAAKSDASVGAVVPTGPAAARGGVVFLQNAAVGATGNCSESARPIQPNQAGAASRGTMRPRAVKLQQGASSSLAAGSSDAVEPGVSVQKKTFPPAAAYQSLAPVKSADRVSAGNDCTTAA